MDDMNSVKSKPPMATPLERVWRPARRPELGGAAWNACEAASKHVMDCIYMMDCVDASCPKFIY